MYSVYLYLRETSASHPVLMRALTSYYLYHLFLQPQEHNRAIRDAATPFKHPFCFIFIGDFFSHVSIMHIGFRRTIAAE